MKTSIKQLVLVSVLSGAAGLAMADDSTRIKVTGDSGYLSAETKALQSCAQQFVNEILPGQDVKVRTAWSSDDVLFSRSRLPQTVKLDLSAKTRDGNELATSTCKVDKWARIHKMKTEIKDAAALATIEYGDLNLVAGIR